MTPLPGRSCPATGGRGPAWADGTCRRLADSARRGVSSRTGRAGGLPADGISGSEATRRQRHGPSAPQKSRSCCQGLSSRPAKATTIVRLVDNIDAAGAIHTNGRRRHRLAFYRVRWSVLTEWGTQAGDATDSSATCVHCGSPLPANTPFCAACGRAVTGRQICPCTSRRCVPQPPASPPSWGSLEGCGALPTRLISPYWRARLCPSR